MEKTFRYFKLNTGTLFVDPKSGLKVTNKNITKIDAKKLKGSKAFNEAIGGGHIIEVKEAEYDEWLEEQGKNAPKIPPHIEKIQAVEPPAPESPEETENLNNWTKDELIEWLQDEDNGVDEDDLAGLSKKSKADLIKLVEQYKED